MESTKDQEDTKMEETIPPWKLYDNPLYSPFSPDLALSAELQEAKAEIADLKAELEFERRSRLKTERLTKTISGELEEERARREAVDRVNDELGIRVLGYEAEVTRIRREIDEEKKMMRVAEVFREGKEKPFSTEKMVSGSHIEGYRGFVSPVSVLRRSASPEPENPHIKRGIKGSVEFQRAVKAMCTSNKNGKQLGQTGNYKLECQKAQLKILLKQRIPVRPTNSYFIS